MASATLTAQALRLPAAVFVRLPVGSLEPAGLRFTPARPCRGNRLVVFAVKQQDDALVGRGILRHRRAVDQKADIRAVRIVVVDGEQHRLHRGLALAIGAVREEIVVAIGPQVSVERVDALLG